jgi:hypothetical protein
MDEHLMLLLQASGYRETSHTSEEGEIVKAIYEDKEGHSVHLYHQKYAL